MTKVEQWVIEAGDRVQERLLKPILTYHIPGIPDPRFLQFEPFWITQPLVIVTYSPKLEDD